MRGQYMLQDQIDGIRESLEHMKTWAACILHMSLVQNSRHDEASKSSGTVAYTGDAR
jgi:hypothetical protein